jgi:hypothetical protein
VILLLLGWWLFQPKALQSSPEREERFGSNPPAPNIGDSFWYCVDVALPIIDLGSESEFTPKTTAKIHLKKAFKIICWINVSILFGVAAGIFS